MTHSQRKTPRGYNGNKSTFYHIRDLLPPILSTIQTKHQARPDALLTAWPQIIGEKIAPMTKALSFDEGVLIVSVKNSTLYSLLSQREKGKILGRLRQTFPQLKIDNIIFRIG